MKRFISFCLALILVLGLLPGGAMPVSAVSTLAELREKYPHNMYWNHYVSDPSECGDALGEDLNEAFAECVTDKPCDSHSGYWNYEDAVGCNDCNFFDGAWQCLGFARLMGYEVYGTRVSGWDTTDDVSLLKPGDVMRYYGDGDYGHSVFVLDVKDNKVTVVEANMGGRCRIVWDRVVDLNKVTVTDICVAPYPLSEVCEHTWLNEIVQKPTTDTPGILQKTCSKCGATRTETIYKPKITTQPQPASARMGKTVHFSVEAEHGDSFQWYYSKDGGKTWVKSTIASAVTPSLTFKLSDTNRKNLYRCRVTAAGGTYTNSQSVSITLIAPAVITTQPVDAETLIGERAGFSVTAENAAAYQWYYSKDGGSSWIKSSSGSAQKPNLTITVTETNKTFLYRCRVKGMDGKYVYSRNAAIIIKPVVITSQPTTAKATVGGKATFKVVAENAVAYQWYYSKDGGKTWVKSTASTAQQAKLTITVTENNKSFLYRCKVTGGDDKSVYSKSAKISVS